MDFFTDLLPALVLSPWMLLIVLLVCVIDGFFPPVPSETTVVAVLAASITAGASPVWAVLVTAVAALGAIAGDSIAFVLGRRFEISRFPWFQGKAAKRVTDWVTARVHASPAVLILVGRYIPGGRVAVNMIAGSAGLPYRKFLGFSAIAGTSWAIMTALVATLSAAWLGNPLWSALLGAGIMLVLGLAIDYIARRRLRGAPAVSGQEADADSMALSGPVAAER